MQLNETKVRLPLIRCPYIERAKETACAALCQDEFTIRDAAGVQSVTACMRRTPRAAGLSDDVLHFTPSVRGRYQRPQKDDTEDSHER